MPGNQRPNPGADQRANASERRAPSAAPTETQELVRVAAAHSRADRESSSKSDSRADGGVLAPPPAAFTVPLDLEHVLSSRGHRTGRHL